MSAAAAPSGPRILLRRLREVMAGEGSAQDRMDQLVMAIAANMVAEVCSIYLLRDGMLELFATEGLKPSAVHKTTLRIGEGLVGQIAQLARPVALSEARSHPNFAARPETGEEDYHSLMGVPVLRGGRVVGVLVLQNRINRDYSADEIEAMQTIAMVLAEMVGGALQEEMPGVGTFGTDGLPRRMAGLSLNEGLARGVAVLHAPRIVVERHVADDVDVEAERLTVALKDLRVQVDSMLQAAIAEPGGESRDILEAYRMFAHDKGWMARLHDAIQGGFTAEAAVERVQVENRARMSEISDAYLRERLHDLEDLSNRLMRHLTHGGQMPEGDVPEQAVVVAWNMGPAELLDYDVGRIKALVLEEGSPTSHVAIVARALQIPVVGRLDGLLDNVESGDDLVVDGDNAQLFVRPAADALVAFSANLETRQAKAAQYAALRDQPAVSKDGTRIELNLNAGLLADMPHLDGTGADGIGLYRTELHFMVRATLPTVSMQTDFYGRVLDQAGGRPVVFRTLDVGGDKMLPYLARHDDEQNPAMGWRAIRLSLDRPVLLRMQIRALLKAAAGRPLSIMFPMIAEVSEFKAARKLLDREVERQTRMGEPTPSTLRVGTMLEVPSLAWQLPALLPLVDFVSIGSNDLMQFLFASDRGNPRLANRYDELSPSALSLVRDIVQRCDAAKVPVSLCGEAAGRPVDAMALLGLGLRSISMGAASVGAVKMMVRSLDLPSLQTFMEDFYDSSEHSLRNALKKFAEDHNVAI
ncbi:MAG: phosphoenolpyruvate--protein phosphotransferase [Alphaproteobacteria bacterium]|nr:phosphoenolpyruvate--protein phosphotransferase [Alphaproteobacteria bacterium]